MTAHDWRAALLRLEGAYSDNTIRTYRTDVQAYETWALREGVEPFPASAGMIATFITARARPDAASTLRRRIYGLRKIHRLLKMPLPPRGVGSIKQRVCLPSSPWRVLHPCIPPQ